MRYLNCVFFICFIISFGCTSTTSIYHIIKPIKNNDAGIVKDRAIIIKRHISITIEPVFGKKLELLRRKEENIIYGKEPLIIIFKVYIKNDNKVRISVPLEKIVLLDSLKNQYPVLTYEDYREIFPKQYYSSSQYSAAYRHYIPYTYKSINSAKRLTAKRSLFRGGYVFSGYKIQSYITFEKIPDICESFDILIPDVIIYDKDNKKSEKIDFKFSFSHVVKRNKK